MSDLTIRLRVNGQDRAARVGPATRLIDVLRDQLGLTGTKEGCSVGVCGACSVLVDGVLLSSCLVPAVLVDDASVTTIEGLAADELTPLQEAFITEGGFQCGICTPGQIIAASSLLAERPRPTEAEIAEWMMGNLCRCTGYYGIVRAIRKASRA
ncbi:MAG: (2Fe-2S)-binding protein [Candidatus Limnocylindria bacterium]|nr:(2Fe-2S)-binding protein [Candidatus Limnocylindria bacterium]